MGANRVSRARHFFLDNRSGSAVEHDVEAMFLKSISLPNGTRKSTNPGRLQDIDEALSGHFAGSESVRLLDVGISTGVTTLELLNSFASRGIHVDGIGVDICVRANLWSFLGIDILFDGSGNVLQVATPFFARGRPLQVRKSLWSKTLGLTMDVLESSFVKRWMARSRRTRPLTLVSPRLLERDDFKVVEHDVGLPMPAWEGSFDLVRAANLLNLAYFSAAQIRAMITNVTSWLKPGGIFVVCRTDTGDESNHGSLYRKHVALPCLEHLHHFGQGSEIHPVLLEMGCESH